MNLKVLFVRDDFSFVHCNWNGFIDNDNVSAYSYYTKKPDELLAKHPVSKLSAKDVEVLKNATCESLVAVFKIKPKSQEEDNVNEVVISALNYISLTGEIKFPYKYPSYIDLNKVKDYDIEFAELISLRTFSDFCDYMLSKDNGYNNMLSFSTSRVLDNINIRCGLSSTYDEAVKIQGDSDVFKRFMIDFSTFLDKSLESAIDYMAKSVDDIKALKFPKSDKLLDIVSRFQYGEDGEIANCMFSTDLKINKPDLEETRKLIKNELNKLKLSWEDWSIAQNIYSVLSMVVRMIAMYKTVLLYSQMNGREILPDVDDDSIPVIRDAYELIKFDLLSFYQTLAMVEEEVKALNNPEVSVHVDDDVLNILSRGTLNYLNKHLVSGYKDIEDDEYESADDIEPYNKFRDCDFMLYSFRNIFKYSFKLKFSVTEDIETRLKSNRDSGHIFRAAKVIQDRDKRYLEISVETLRISSAAALLTLIKEYKMNNGGR